MLCSSSHTLCALLSETFSYIRSLLSFVYVSIFIFPLIPFFPFRNAFASSSAFFIRFAPSFCPDFIHTAAPAEKATRLETQAFYSYSERQRAVLVRSMLNHCMRCVFFYSARMLCELFPAASVWVENEGAFLGGGWFDVIYNIFFILFFFHTLFFHCYEPYIDWHEQKKKRKNSVIVCARILFLKLWICVISFCCFDCCAASTTKRSSVWVKAEERANGTDTQPESTEYKNIIFLLDDEKIN